MIGRRKIVSRELLIDVNERIILPAKREARQLLPMGSEALLYHIFSKIPEARIT